MKRVLLISTVHPATDSRIMYKIAPSLQNRYEIFCALPDLKVSSQPGMSLINLPHFERLLPRLFFAHPVALWKCLRVRPHIVHIFVPELIPFAILFQWLGIKVIYEVQENLFKKFEIKKYNNALIFKTLFVYFDKIARKRFHCVFTDDAYLNEYKNLARPFAVIHNYVSLPVVDAVGHSEALMRGHGFFYLGVVSMERCLDTMINALARLKRQHSDFHMHFFGPLRVSRQELEGVAGYREIKDNITFHGYTDQKTALQYAGNAIAGIALLKPVADYPESYPTKLFEYMALELPVITSDFPGYRSIVEDSGSGFCISPYDAEALFAKLDWCTRNKSKRAQMGRNGRVAAEKHYNWLSEEALLLSFYQNVLSERPTFNRVLAL
jgi:glycosyltransferase involved in cell wall biosynthesis